MTDDEGNRSPTKKSVTELQNSPDIEKLFSRLNLDHTQYQRFGHPRTDYEMGIPALAEGGLPKIDETGIAYPPVSLTALEVPVRDASPQKLLHVGVYSPMGGSGKSMLAASMGALLCHMGRRVLLVDTSPWKTLTFHFGAQEAKEGMRIFYAPDGGGASVHVLSCDSSLPPPDLSTLATSTPMDSVIFDLGGLSEDLAPLWLKACDRVIIPLLPTSPALVMASATREKIYALGFDSEKFIFVLNLMDRTPASSRVKMLLGELLSEQLFAEGIERQEIVDEALGEGIVLPYYAPNSQAARVCREIVGWLRLPELTQKRTARQWIEG
jgi:cellulose biosynthesis protein BcsQ